MKYLFLSIIMLFFLQIGSAQVFAKQNQHQDEVDQVSIAEMIEEMELGVSKIEDPAKKQAELKKIEELKERVRANNNKTVKATLNMEVDESNTKHKSTEELKKSTSKAYTGNTDAQHKIIPSKEDNTKAAQRKKSIENSDYIKQIHNDRKKKLEYTIEIAENAIRNSEKKLEKIKALPENSPERLETISRIADNINKLKEKVELAKSKI